MLIIKCVFFCYLPYEFLWKQGRCTLFFLQRSACENLCHITMCVKEISILGYRPIKMLEEDLVKSPLCLALFKPHKKIKVDD